MARTARAQFPWKTIRENVPYEGHTRRSDRARKTRTTLLETVTAKLMLLPKFVLFKMSDESEHSESEFYDPGETSHAELLQSPTHSESKERNLTLLANKEARNLETKNQTGGQGNNFSR